MDILNMDETQMKCPWGPLHINVDVTLFLREYLPIHEHEEHKRWHAEPPYMGQKIRIENGEPVIVDRKERASLTPIGNPWEP